MRYPVILILTAACFVIACSKRPTTDQTAEQTTEQDSAVISVELNPVELTPDVQDSICAEAPKKATTSRPSQSKPSSTKANSTQSSAASTRSSQSNSSSYASDSEEQSDDYLEEIRKHSPNDNYLLGFDEDVDDVHDMEIYIEDY